MSKKVTASRTLRTAELHEKAVNKRLASLSGETNPEITVEETPEGVDIHITACEKTREEAEEVLVRTEGKIRGLFADYIYGTDQQTLQERIGQLLDEQGLTVATMESLTGGLIASALTDVHDSSAHYLGGIVAYSVVLKERCGVPHEVIEKHGVVSEETGRAMATAVRKLLDIEIGLGITGVAGPGSEEGKPEGTVYIAVDGPHGLMSCMGSERCAGPDREGNKYAATISALNLLRRYLEGKEMCES